MIMYVFMELIRKILIWIFVFEMCVLAYATTVLILMTCHQTTALYWPNVHICILYDIFLLII